MNADERGFMEYLIRRTDGDWFDLHADRHADVFLRVGSDDTQVPDSGDFCFKRDGVEVQVNGEIAGLHIIIEPVIDDHLADQWLNEFLQRLQNVTNQKGEFFAI